MNIYTDEFMKFIEKAEDYLIGKYTDLGKLYGNNSMFEVRNLSIGDSGVFGDDNHQYHVNPQTHSIDVINEIFFLSRKSEDEVMLMLWKSLEKDILQKISDKVHGEDLKIETLSDVMKVVKVVIDTDVYINHVGFELRYGLGVQIHKKELAK